MLNIYIENTIITGTAAKKSGPPKIYIASLERHKRPIDAGNNNKKYIFITFFNIF